SVIQSEIDDITDEYIGQIQESIFAAIRFCERESFYFNESRDVVFTTQAGKGVYDATDTRHIETAVKIKSVFLFSDQHHKIELKQRSPFSLEPSLSSDQQGTPVYYSYFDRKLHLYPTPDRAYQVQLLLSPVRLEELENANQEHPWFVHGFDLIKARAKYELYKNILKEPDCAAAAYNDFNEQLHTLRAETSQRHNVSRIIPTDF
uniref:phage adaptor protein n=1 Tax=Bartonella sp. ML70XJBT.G TaxID=3019093 RepID=UPI00235EC277